MLLHTIDVHMHLAAAGRLQAGSSSLASLLKLILEAVMALHCGDGSILYKHQVELGQKHQWRHGSSHASAGFISYNSGMTWIVHSESYIIDG